MKLHIRRERDRKGNRIHFIPKECDPDREQKLNNAIYQHVESELREDNIMQHCFGSALQFRHNSGSVAQTSRIRK